MNIYLDIDQVLITKESVPAPHVLEFLEYIIAKHQVYWLTTHCRGDARVLVGYLKDKLPAKAIPILEKIKPTAWQTLKTEAIDFGKDFRWLDDYAMQAELDALAENNAADKIILIDLKSDPDILKRLIDQF